jgi:hypothetical protein
MTFPMIPFSRPSGLMMDSVRSIAMMFAFLVCGCVVWGAGD